MESMNKLKRYHKYPKEISWKKIHDLLDNWLE